MASYSEYYPDDPTDLWRLVDDMHDCHVNASKAECAYESAKARKTLEMKASGMPVGVIDKVVKGDPEVNNAYFAWKCADALYKAAAEAVNVRKIEVKMRNESHSAEYRSL